MSRFALIPPPASPAEKKQRQQFEDFVEGIDARIREIEHVEDQLRDLRKDLAAAIVESAPAMADVDWRLVRAFICDVSRALK